MKSIVRATTPHPYRAADFPKCDETLPQCQRCIKRQIQCSLQGTAYSPYTPTSVFGDGDATPETPSSSTAAEVVVPNQASVPRQSAPNQLNQASIGQSSMPFSLLDLELIHHYSTRTYMTISSQLKLHHIWRDVIFQEALQQDFLLHGLVATAALHKATSQPVSSESHAEYSRVALAYQNASLARFIPQLSKPSSDNAVALFSLSILLTVWAFASKQLPEGMNSLKLKLSFGETSSGPHLPATCPTSEFVEVAHTLRGIYAVIKETEVWLQGDIRELMRSPRTEELPPITPDMSSAFDLVGDVISRWDGRHDAALTSVEERRTLCLDQLNSLREISRCRLTVEWDGSIFGWLVLAPATFINSLKQGDPLALSLLAHWSACFLCMDHHWWANGWAYILIKDISGLLGNEWNRAMQWPRKQVGLPC